MLVPKSSSQHCGLTVLQMKTAPVQSLQSNSGDMEVEESPSADLPTAGSGSGLHTQALLNKSFLSDDSLGTLTFQ